MHHLESYKNPKLKSSRSSCVIQSCVISSGKGKAESEMKLYGHVQTISATRASKLFSGKLQESISESHSVMSNPLQPHGEYWSG